MSTGTLKIQITSVYSADIHVLRVRVIIQETEELETSQNVPTLSL